MRILLACEESQRCCIAFRAKGHEAYSCDIEPCSGGHPEWHIQEDVALVLEDKWDMMIAFPPCTFLTSSNTYIKRGCSLYTPEEAELYRHEAILFFFMLADAPVHRIAIENPVGIMSSHFRKPDQIIQPYHFGHPESKSTCLWLKNLPLLVPTEEAEFKRYRCKCGNVYDVSLGKYGCCDVPAKPLWDNQCKGGQNKLGPSPDRAKIRSKTYTGIAEAMANQWG